MNEFFKTIFSTFFITVSLISAALNWLVLFWYAYDDYIAEIMQRPELGTVHVMIWFIISVITYAIAEAGEKLYRNLRS